jgi:hypothetical protein
MIMGKNPKYINAYDYFLQKVDISSPNSCWPWLGSLREGGHGSWAYRCYQNGTKIASREIFKLFKGDPGILYVCHLCGNARCCNPDHLYLGTPKENQQDRLKHNTSNRGSRCGTAKLTEENVKEIKKLIKNKIKLKEIAEVFKVSESTIKAIKQKKNWAHIPDD